MNRKHWYAWVASGSLAVALGVYLFPLIRPPVKLAALTASQVFRRSRAAMTHNQFTETVRYQESLLPSAINAARLLNLPIPDSNVNTMVLYQASPWDWRLEEMNNQNTVVGVIARRHNRVVTYQPMNNERSIDSLPHTISSAWSLWQVPKVSALNWSWTASVRVVRKLGHAAYQVTMTPTRQGTLWGSVRYWYQGTSFLPLGVTVSARGGGAVLAATVSSLHKGIPAKAASPPMVGRLVAWKVSPALASLLQRAGRGTMSPNQTFPKRLGPLSRVSEHQSGQNALAVYGSGPGRVLVMQTASHLFKGRPGRTFFRPVRGFPQFEGVTDGIFSLVTFRVHNREVILMGSRSKDELARWAKNAWQ